MGISAIFLFKIFWQGVGMEFEDWLVSEGLSLSSVKKYVGALDGPLTQWGIEHKIISKPLRQVFDSDEFHALSELIETTEIFAERNLRGNHMYGAALNQYARYLTHNGVAGMEKDCKTGSVAVQLGRIEQTEDQSGPFEPNTKEDARERVLRTIVRRRGQPIFRSKLIAAYEGRCAITHCPVLPILEAAHVTPYLGPQTNAVTNGLLLRADIHTLWDLGLIAIDPGSMTVMLSPTLHDPGYQVLAGEIVFQPIAKASRVSQFALVQQLHFFHAQLIKAL